MFDMGIIINAVLGGKFDLQKSTFKLAAIIMPDRIASGGNTRRSFKPLIIGG
jgi:hypothetical protein